MRFSDLQRNNWYSNADISASFLFNFGTAPLCAVGLDIGIVLDKSKSISKTNLKKAIKFLKNLIQEFNPAPDADHFGFTFNRNAKVVFNFANSDYHNKKDLLTKIWREPIQLGYETRTDLALKAADKELFTKAGGDRPDKPNVMLVLTDGKPTCPKKKKKGKREFDVMDFTHNIAKDLKVGTLHLLFYSFMKT